MSILFFCKKNKRAGKRLLRVVESQVSADKLGIYHTIQSLSHRLCQPRYDLAVIVLVAATREDLLDLLTLRDLLYNIDIILILPDRGKETAFIGHKFYPRYISFIDNDFTNVALVLAKMMANAAFKEKRIRKGGEVRNHYVYWHDIDTNNILPS